MAPGFHHGRDHRLVVEERPHEVKAVVAIRVEFARFAGRDNLPVCLWSPRRGGLECDGTTAIGPKGGVCSPYGFEQGAATIVWCATSPQLEGMGGVYCESCEVARVMTERPSSTTMADATRLTGVMPYAIEPDGADRLWTLSERLLSR